ncbi:MAG: hypothetical protein ACJ77U_00120 [Chloroflexota bacterium]
MTVEFDPERLDRGRRRFEPAVIGAVVVALAIGAAIAKPWESATPGPEESQAAVMTPSTPAPPASATEAPPEASAGPDWTSALKVVTEHDEWGVTAVLRHGPGVAGPAPTTAPRYTEWWAPISNNGNAVEMAVVPRGGAEVAALAVTAPDAVNIRGVRWWELHQSNEFEWINAARIDGRADVSAPLLARVPARDAASVVPWDAGQYRADVLTDDGIHRISVEIAKQFGDIPRPDDWPSGGADSIAAIVGDPSAIRVGMFATVDGGAVSIPARASEPLSEAAAWHDLAVDTDPAVAAIYLPHATALGVMLTSHAAVQAASIQRLSPDPLPKAPTATGGISNTQGRTPFVMFEAPGGVWTPGVYAVTVDWQDAAGAHHGAWHVELRPGAG